MLLFCIEISFLGRFFMLKILLFFFLLRDAFPRRNFYHVTLFVAGLKHRILPECIFINITRSILTKILKGILGNVDSHPVAVLVNVLVLYIKNLK